MKIRKAGERKESMELNMTAMIDIVFQLLIFFIMTFKIVTLEGDFNIKMPVAAPSPGMPETPLPPMQVRLTSDANGQLTSVRFFDQSLGGSTYEEKFRQLRGRVLGELRRGGADITEAIKTAEVEIDADYALSYEFVIDAITACTGQIGPDGYPQKLVEKVKFAPPREPTGG